MIRVFLLLGLSLHTVASATGFNGAVLSQPQFARNFAAEASSTRSPKFTSTASLA
jgi:hypothetical protein